MTKALQLARLFSRAGHKVILAEAQKYWASGHAYSNCVDKFYTLPNLKEGSEAYFSGLGSIVAEEAIDRYVPVASPTSVYLDAEWRSRGEEAYHEFIFDEATLDIIDNKFQLCKKAREIGLSAPEVELITDIKDFDRTAHGYLKADKVRVDTLRREMGLEDKQVIGISWKSIRSLTTSKKSMMLKDFGTMFKGMDIVLLNLQYGDVQEEIDEFTKDTGIEVLQCKSVDNREDLDGLAALIEICDLVVSTSNITIHLAGALGKETWVLLPFVANFWWLLDRTDSIWYPTLRLYRQKTLDDWGGVLSIIHQDLQKKFGE